MNFEQARFNMVEQQIRPWEVLDQLVLDVISATPREQFVPPEFQRVAYSDSRIPIGHGESMMAPKVEGRLVQALDVTPSDRGLEIGTGSGFVTALLAKLCRELTTIDIYGDFSGAAEQRLKTAGLNNVQYLTQDGCDGHVEGGPYDFMAVTGSVAVLDTKLQEQLTIGGRLFVVVGNPPIMEARLVRRISESAFTNEALFETDLKALVGAEPTREFQF